MRKVVLFIASSLDGYIARRSGEVDWLFTDQDYGYSDFFATVDTVVMGRRTYEQALTFGEYPYQGTQGFVFSKTRTEAGDDPVTFVSDDVKNVVQQLKHSPGQSIWLIGGAELVHAFLQQELIDELVLSVHPILLGDGIPLFQSPFAPQTFCLQSCQSFDTGLVQLTYQRLEDGH